MLEREIPEGEGWISSGPLLFLEGSSDGVLEREIPEGEGWMDQQRTSSFLRGVECWSVGVGEGDTNTGGGGYWRDIV